MSLNLHNIVRPVIRAVNEDTPAKWLVSTGSTPNLAGKQIPSYAAPVCVRAQVQPPSGKALRHAEFMNIQGTTRSVYMYGEPAAIGRVSAKGGDLLQFPGVVGGPIENWLVTMVEEKGWNLDDGSWCRVMVVLQTDRPAQ
jgi:hypothetical protein